MENCGICMKSYSFYGKVDENSETVDYTNSLPPKQLTPRKFTAKSHVCICSHVHMRVCMLSLDTQCRTSFAEQEMRGVKYRTVSLMKGFSMFL